jgi:hypothetical protein
VIILGNDVMIFKIFAPKNGGKISDFDLNYCYLDIIKFHSKGFEENRQRSAKNL